MLAESPLRLALVGCGAVSKASLLPVLAGHDAVSIHALVDRDERRARELADAYGIARVLTDADGLTRDQVDAVVLATPPAHHAPATVALAGRGLHVFVEKPMAMTGADARAMVDAADRANVVLSVGLYRRFLPAVQLLRELIARGDFGRPLSVDAEEGGPYGWQLATLDVLTKAAGGGGTLIDLGSHVIDVVLYALGATPALERYADNNRGGIETDCVMHATLRTQARTVPFRLELSRTRELRGSIRVRCEQATLELLRGNFTEILIHRDDAAADGVRPYRLSASWDGPREYVGYAAFRSEFDDWLDAIRARREPVLSGRSVVPVVSLIDECYARRTDLPEPWTDEGFRAAPAVAPGGRRRRVLVTGAGGFLGNRTVELLRDRFGCDPVALIREPKGAARLARWPGEIVLGDVCSRADMDRAMQGCDAVVHCAVGTSWKPEETRRVTVEGTRTVAEAARAAGVKRVVHISTLFVHQRDLGGTLDENTPLNPPPSDGYGTAKLEAERALAAVARQGLSTIVLRPTRIYGPFSKTFTVRPLQALVEGRFAIAGDPHVPANMVYVDNVVEAIGLALDAPQALSGSAYLVNDPDQLSLLEFFDYFARVSGASISLAPARAASGAGSSRRGWLAGLQTIALAPEVRALVHRIMDTDPVGTLPRKLWEASPEAQRRLLKLFRVDAAVVYRPPASEAGELLEYSGESALVATGKLERELSFAAAVPPARAMATTLAWAREARLVPAPQPADAAVPV